MNGKRTSLIKRLLLPLLCALPLCGCGASAPEPASKTVFAMDTVMTLTIYGTKYGGDPETVLRDAETLICQLEKELSVTDEDGDLYAVNRDGSGTVSGDAAGLLSTALGLCEWTDGALDITMYPVSLAWGFTTGEYQVPDRETLDALLEHAGYTRVHDEPWARTVTLEEGTMIDLGALAKGYAGDQLRQLILQRMGEDAHALLDLGGNVVTVGTKPDGSLWRVGVRDPGDGGGVAGVVEIADRQVVTSGGYERYFEQDGVRYWHILDPATGEPARSGLASVTIVGSAGSGVFCDAYSTALFVMGPEKAAEFWRANDNFDMILIAEDGGVTITEGIEKSFSLAGNYRGAPLTVLRR